MTMQNASATTAHTERRIEARSSSLSGLTSTQSRFESLTAPEREICLMLAAGMDGTQVASRLGACPQRLQALRFSVLRKMGVDSQLQLSCRMDRLREAGENIADRPTSSSPAAEPVKAIFEVLILDSHVAHGPSLRKAVEALGHRAVIVGNQQQIHAALTGRRIDFCMVSRAHGHNLLPYLRAKLIPRDTPCIVLYEVRARGGTRLRDFGDTISADVEAPVSTEAVASIIRFATCAVSRPGQTDTEH
jgi:DNA-binding CsgD family transcriptional regulator